MGTGQFARPARCDKADDAAPGTEVGEFGQMRQQKGACFTASGNGECSGEIENRTRVREGHV